MFITRFSHNLNRNEENLLVSFSGGETSAYLAKWLIDNKSKAYNMIFVFANTGDEEEETLKFIDLCAKKMEYKYSMG